MSCDFLPRTHDLCVDSSDILSLTLPHPGLGQRAINHQQVASERIERRIDLYPQIRILSLEMAVFTWS